MSESATKLGSGPYLRLIIANEFYDGEVAGVGVRTDDDAPVWFRMLAWDDEQWERVFAIARIDEGLLDKLVRALEKVEPQRSPFWLPGRASGTPEIQDIWNDILNAALNNTEWRVVEGHALLEPVTEYALDSSDIPHVMRAARSGAVSNGNNPGLTESVLRRLRTHAY